MTLGPDARVFKLMTLGPLWLMMLVPDWVPPTTEPSSSWLRVRFLRVSFTRSGVCFFTLIWRWPSGHVTADRTPSVGLSCGFLALGPHARAEPGPQRHWLGVELALDDRQVRRRIDL